MTLYSEKSTPSLEDVLLEQTDIESSGSTSDEGYPEHEDDLEATVIGVAGGPPVYPVEEGGDMESTSQFNCPSVGIHPSPACDSFYLCSKVGLGGASLHACGAGLHFDANIKACNWPVMAKCSHSLAAAEYYTAGM